MQNDNKKTKSNILDRVFSEDFKYTHNNPYHDRLAVFDKFVLRDDEAESLKGKWKKDVFKNEHPLIVEVGTGYGHFMMDFTQKNPDINYIGLDHRFKRSFHLAKNLAKLTHHNFKYLRARGERLEHLFADNEVSKLFYFFPDPWPKTRHHKKRLFQEKFIDTICKILKPDGEILIKTDHDGYYEWMLEKLKNENRLQISLKTYDLRSEFPDHFLSSFQTKFEKIFLAKGVKIKAICLRNIK